MNEPTRLPANPVLYEINTWVWLHDLRQKYGDDLTLGTVPAVEWDALADLGLDAVWLMGVWQRSPAGRQIALGDEGLLREFKRVLPDFSADDVAGSPYCIRGYHVDEALGGRAGLAAARSALAARGIGLLLDFVPNHVAPDHPWTHTHPEYFVQGSALELAHSPGEFLGVDAHIYARGRDPYFAPWQDVVQLNAFAPALRQNMISTLLDIASQCDGVRCDMAMLMNTEIFSMTWGARAGAAPELEYWTEVIGAVKQLHPHFLWVAEVYWAMEGRMQQLGFDYCYDKQLYDYLVKAALGTPAVVAEVAEHLHADPAYQRKLVRFVENHDEPRAATAFPAERLRAATLVCATQWGARLFHEGQFDGRRAKVSVFLGRRPAETADTTLQTWSRQLLQGLRQPLLQDGIRRPCTVVAADEAARTGEPSSVLSWCWLDPAESTIALIAVNLSDNEARVRIAAPLPLVRAESDPQPPGDPVPPGHPVPPSEPLRMEDRFDASAVWHSTLAALSSEGVPLTLAPWAAHFWQVRT